MLHRPFQTLAIVLLLLDWSARPVHCNALDAREPLSVANPVSDLGFVKVSDTAHLPNGAIYSLTKLVPTTAFFINLIVGEGSGRENTVGVLPYIAHGGSGLGVSYPHVELIGTTNFQSLYDPVFNLVALSSLETEAARVSHKIAAFDELCATLRWTASGGHSPGLPETSCCCCC